MSFPKTGSSFPSEISAALQAELGHSRSAIKTLVRWTGASERTAKNWLSGRFSPSGEHLVALARNSDHVLRTMMRLAGRSGTPAIESLSGARGPLRDALAALDELIESSDRHPNS